MFRETAEEIMTDAAQLAIQALTARAHELRSERVKVGRRLLEDAVRDVELERDINGCVAGVKALGGQLAFPANPLLSVAATLNAYNQFVQNRAAVATQHGTLKALFGVPLDNAVESETDSEDARANMPRIADIIGDRLREAGDSGSKAADIRKFILDTYDADIHDKTVSMTLNRLQKEGLVRREGHIWFSASVEAKNPGAENAGAQ